MKRFSFRFFSVFCLLILLSGCRISFWEKGIVETKEITDLSRYANKGSLVVFDIDLTIFKSFMKNKANEKLELNFDAIINHISKNAQKECESKILKKVYDSGIDKSKEEEIQKLIKRNFVNSIEKELFSSKGNFYKHVQKELVDPKIIDEIKNLEEHGAKVMALTGRSWYQKNNTKEELNSFGMYLGKNTIYDKELLRKKCLKEHGFGFYDGVLHVIQCPNIKSKAEKGNVLINFFKEINYTPKKVVFVDDTKKNIDSVFNTLEKNKIPVVALWYNAVNYNTKVLPEADLKFIEEVVGKNWDKIKINVDKISKNIVESLKEDRGTVASCEFVNVGGCATVA